MIPRPPINIRSKGQSSRSQGHKVQNIEDDRVAGVALYRVTSLCCLPLVHFKLKHLRVIEISTVYVYGQQSTYM